MIRNRLLNIRLRMVYKKTKDFANFIGIHPNQLGRYENNKVQPSIDIAYAICKKLNMNIDEVFYEIED